MCLSTVFITLYLVPALSISTKQRVNISSEIFGHGLSNIISGCFGTVQNYLVYSNSVLYFRSGGKTRVGGVLVIILTALLFLRGLLIIFYVPIILVGSLIFHLGIELCKESIFDTLFVGMHTLEYLTIIATIIMMVSIGFTEGLLIAIVLSCLCFGIK
jgi:SulP family sulfate permease